jgi:ATP-dependent RNA helicase SUPV3L1/SUV3
MKRKFHYHMGPTNSGKTKNALEILKKARTGCYLSPLRLLAMEVHTQLSQGSQDPETGFWEDGVVCNLKTGPLKHMIGGATHSASTIEMLDFDQEFDVAVIDEIQLINDPTRGHNWTNAVLGLKAHEIHLCGDERAFSIIQHLLSKTEDELHVHQYGRLSSLKADDENFKNWNDL